MTFAKIKIKKGVKIQNNMLIFKRPSVNSKGISALNYKDILGKKTNKNILKNQLIKKNDFEKNKKINILITCIGGEYAYTLVNCLRTSKNSKFKIIGIDKKQKLKIGFRGLLLHK